MQLDGAKLQQIFQQSQTGKSVLDHLSKRQRDRTFVDIGRLHTKLIHEGVHLNEEEYHQLWESIKASGIGTIIAGRRGGPARFQANFSLKKFADAAISGRMIEVERIKSKNSKARKQKADMKKTTENIVETPKAPVHEIGNMPATAMPATRPQAGAVLQVPCTAGTVKVVVPQGATREDMKSVVDYLSCMFT